MTVTYCSQEIQTYPDSLEVVTDVYEWPAIVACGIYKHFPENNCRIGGIEFVKVVKEDEFTISTSGFIDSNCGVFDLRVMNLPHEQKKLIFAGSDDNVWILDDCNTKIMNTWTSVQKCCRFVNISEVESTAVGTCIDCYNSEIVAGNSNGCCVMIKENENVMHKWKAHDAPLWTIDIDPTDNTIATGGDDCCTRLWDMREKNAIETLHHREGVTAISHNQSFLHSLFTGSYDDSLRWWDKRKLNRPLWIGTTSGGVWQIKWDTKNPFRCILACCYGGSQIWNIEEGCSMSLKTSYTGHSSLVYGVSFLHSEEIFCASCSFLDHSVKLWKVFDNEQKNI